MTKSENTPHTSTPLVAPGYFYAGHQLPSVVVRSFKVVDGVRYERATLLSETQAKKERAALRRDGWTVSIERQAS